MRTKIRKIVGKFLIALSTVEKIAQPGNSVQVNSAGLSTAPSVIANPKKIGRKKFRYAENVR